MPLSRSEIETKVHTVLMDALGVDADEITPSATLREDLGAESIDFLDIVFRLERSFTTDPAKPFKIPRGELFPENLLNDAKYVQGDKITPLGVSELKKRMPFSDFTEFDKDPSMEKMQSLFTVNTIVNYVQSKLAATA